MASLKYYLDKPHKATQLCALYLRYKSLLGNATFYVGVTTPAARWDGKAQRLRGTSLEAKKTNQTLISFQQSIEACIKELREQQPMPSDPDPTQLKQLAVRTVPELQLRQRAAPAKVAAPAANAGAVATGAPKPIALSLGRAATLPELLLQVRELRQGELRQGSLLQYQYTYNCLLRFCAASDARWALRNLTPAFLGEWRRWLVAPTPPGVAKQDTRYRQGKLSKLTGEHELVPGGLGVDNCTANNRLAIVAATLNYARRHDPYYRKLLSEELIEVCQRKFKKLVQPREHLTSDELLRMYHAPLPPEATASEYVVRDLYCLSWLTSLRQSDMLLLGPQHLVWAGEARHSTLLGLDITSLKSGVVTEVPLNELAAGIVLRWLDREARLAPATRELSPRLRRQPGQPDTQGQEFSRSLGRFRWPADRLFPQISKNRFEIIKRMFEHLGLFNEPVEVISSRGAEQLRQTVPRWQLLTLHTARHGFGNFMAAQNVPIEDAQLLMGHRELDSTRVYYHRPKQHALDRARQVLDTVRLLPKADEDTLSTLS